METAQQATSGIQRLIDKYDELAKMGKVKNYNEAQTRNEFIEPLFELLGWDMRNFHNFNEVTTEEKVSKGRVDLAFRTHGIPVMFLEAKALRENLDEWKWAEQAINYAWNKGVTWAVLTDFEGIKVFNAEIPPTSLYNNLFFELKYHEYVSDIERLWLLSKESFLEKRLDAAAEKWGKKQRRTNVSDKLFADLLKWRQELGHSFEEHNEGLSQATVDEGVQRLLDRLLFIKVAEDREIEPPLLAPLVRTLAGHKSLYASLAESFRNFDAIYNSKLFAEHASEHWIIDDAPLVKVINGLYGTKDGYRYDFSALSADVLGGIYEQYLSHIHKRRSEEFEVVEGKQKEQGIYYTPTYVVDFIVKHTVGTALTKINPRNILNPKSVNDIKILDPACGSGSFLIRAYDEIAKYDKPKNQEIDLFANSTILTNNIYGVDLDNQAVEIAQLNLLLKSLTRRVKLPSLNHNIRHGNSLLSGTKEELLAKFGSRYDLKSPFHWHSEFKEVFDRKNPGFDVIIGNPPYIKEATNRLAFEDLHDSPYYQGKMDIWTMFASVAIDLLRDGGLLGFIAPANWITSSGASLFRKKVLSEGVLETYVDFGDFHVFKNAGIQTMILIFRKSKPPREYALDYRLLRDSSISVPEVNAGLSGEDEKVFEQYLAKLNPSALKGKTISFVNNNQSELLSHLEEKANYRFPEKCIGNGIDVLQDMVSKQHLSKLRGARVDVGEGIFVLNKEEVARLGLSDKERKILKPYFTSRLVNRFKAVNDSELSIIYADKSFRENIDEFPKLKAHIEKFAPVLTSAYAPFGLHRPREEALFNGEGIFVLRKTMQPAFSYVNFPCYVSRAFLIIKPDVSHPVDLKYLTGLLNSSLMHFWLSQTGKKQGSQLQIDKEPLTTLPIYTPPKEQQKEIIHFVSELIKLHGQLANVTPLTDGWRELRRLIEEYEGKINYLVYQLYELSPAQVQIIEATLPQAALRKA